MSQNLNLYEPLNESYKTNNDAKKDLNGYKLDEKLSNDNHKVYYNAEKERGNRLLVTYRGTSNLKDVGTDMYLAVGKLRDTDRYKKSSDVLKESKAKYNEENAIISGHSLGGGLSKAVAQKGDKVVAYNSGNGLFGSNFNHKTKDIKDYRTANDLVSVLGKNSKNTTTLKNKNWVQNALTSHTLGNIQKSKLFI